MSLLKVTAAPAGTMKQPIKDTKQKRSAQRCIRLSLRFRDVTPDRGGCGQGNRAMVDQRFEDIGQLMVQGLWSFAPEFHETIINATMVDQAPVGKKHGGGRDYLDFGKLDKFMLWIAEFRRSQLVLAGMMANLIGGLSWVRMNKPEGDAVRREAGIKTVDFRCIAVGDWTIVVDENQHYRTRGFVCERI